jgi:hypothetical protein
MKFSYEKPPNWELLTAHFPVDWNTVIVTYGDTIHSKEKIHFLKEMHELIHTQQQTKMDKDVWWDKYIKDKEFRLYQELEAYANEIAWAKKVIQDRNEKQRYLHQIYIDISSPMYGNMVSFSEAKQLLT